MDTNRLKKLRGFLDFCILKTGSKERTSSLAITKNSEYFGALIGSDTHLLNISSEQAALALSTSSIDYPVTELVTIFDGDFILSPIVLKILIDYTTRTQTPMKYSVVNTDGEKLFETDSIQTFLPFYKPAQINISKTKEQYSPNVGRADSSDLKKYALKGLDRNFPLYDNASSYGTAVYTASGNIYYAGQYSSPDKRLNLHAEMVAVLSALMNNDHDIKAIGLVSTKYPDTPCNMCGICRQFILEITSKFKISPELYCFASENEKFKKWSIEEYLPDSWSSKNW